MQKKFKEKYNEGCIKVFTIIKLLYEDRAYYDDVMAVFMTEGDKEKQHVMLNKFLNTLKIFGLKIVKTNNQYKILNNPFPVPFDFDDIKSVNCFEKYYNALPEGKLKNSLKLFLDTVKERFNDQANEMLLTMESTDKADFSFYFADRREQIDRCEKVCRDSFKINLKYLDNNEEISVFCIPKQMIYENKQALLRVYKISECEIADIPVPKITEIEQLPTIKAGLEVPKVVTYKITGRLSNAYILKENEYMREQLPDGSKIIVNKGEPTEQLLKRLLRYDYDCTVLAPKELRTKMISLINDTLKNYA